MHFLNIVGNYKLTHAIIINKINSKNVEEVIGFKTLSRSAYGMLMERLLYWNTSKCVSNNLISIFLFS
jgi:hypothetical protein